jgi:prepilin-type N-terminal cleavage/methylation domain-containing protein
MKPTIQRNGFTMIELLFVIVILGIVGGFALETVRQYYENIFRTQEYTKRVAEADHILEQLTKYFENGISTSIVNLDRTVGENVCYGPPVANDANDYTVAFAAVDHDSLRGLWNGTRFQPGWSEDVLLSDNNITALDANYTAANTIITAFGSTLLNSAVYDADSVDVGTCSRFNLNNDGGGAGYHTIDAATTTRLSLNGGNQALDGKRKYLLRTAYAFRVLPNESGDFMMYTNFEPWNNERYNTDGTSFLLGRNVAHFYADYNATDFQNDSNVTDRGLVWRLKVCMRGVDANLSMSSAEGQSICRERRVHVRY